LDAICLIGAPRTGVSHLCAVLRNFPDLAAYHGPFDADVIEGTETATWPLLRRLAGVDFTSGRDKQLIEFAHQRPAAWLDALESGAAAAGKRLMTFRLFPADLSLETAEQQVMTRHGLRPILVMRKQIDVYISLRKAVELAKWQGFDTTGVKVRLDANRFEEWLNEQERWYRHWKGYFERRYTPCPVVRYELDIDQPADRLLRRFASTAAQVGVTLVPPASIAHAGLEKQDKSKSMIDKVSNWAEFSRDIFSLGLERRAFGYPL
jgi:hypothetical protein